MSKKILLSAVLTASLFSFANAKDISGFSHPEGSLITKDAIYISNLGAKLDPMAKDKDGFISKLDKNGKLVEAKFISSNLNAPKGMANVGDTLIVLDIDRILAFDLKSKKELFVVDVKGGIFLNDIALLDDNTAFISDTGTGIVHKFDIKSKKLENFVSLNKEFMGPNGLLLSKDKKTLYTVTYDAAGKEKGRLVSINLADKSQKSLTEPIGALDGIVYAKNGDILFSSWEDGKNGTLYRYDNKGKLSKEKPSNMGGPADMSTDGTTLYIPKMIESKVLKIKLP